MEVHKVQHNLFTSTHGSDTNRAHTSSGALLPIRFLSRLARSYQTIACFTEEILQSHSTVNFSQLVDTGYRKQFSVKYMNTMCISLLIENNKECILITFLNCITYFVILMKTSGVKTMQLWRIVEEERTAIVRRRPRMRTIETSLDDYTEQTWIEHRIIDLSLHIDSF